MQAGLPADPEAEGIAALADVAVVAAERFHSAFMPSEAHLVSQEVEIPASVCSS